MQLEDPFAVQWHLERVMAAGGDGPLVRLLRARARADLGQIASAVDDLEHALPDMPRTATAWRFFLVTAIKLASDSRSYALRKRALDTMHQDGIRFELAGADSIALATQFGQDRRWQAAALVLEPFRIDSENVEGPNLYHVDQDLMVGLIHAGNRDGYQALSRSILERAEVAKNAEVRYLAIFNCALAPDSLADYERLVKLAEKPFAQALPGPSRAFFLRPLGAALYRAGRYEECIAKIQESIQLRGGESKAFDHAFLAMAYARKGNLTETRNWLAKLTKFDPPDSPEVFWDKLQIRLLENEARAMIIHDPSFPSIPFTS
jgi:tetratricopeptide (TPR) repeat protein